MIIWVAFACLCLVLTCTGCANSDQTVQRWINNQGGVELTNSSDRAKQALDHLLQGQPKLKNIQIQILATNALSAYSWPSGQVFVSRGLLNRMTDEELSAAIAHELGHLIDGKDVNTVAGLRGCELGSETESRADKLGTHLLESRGIKSEAMISMLTKLAESGTLTPMCKQAILRRIDLLHSAA